jgi:hypothetical protein
MKKILFALTIGLFALTTNAQSTMTPTIKNEKSSFVQGSKTSATSFQLTVSDIEIKKLKEKAATMSTIKLTANKLKGGTFSCSLTIFDNTDALYVQRVFGFLGFEKFIIDGVEKSRDELAKNLSSLK